jgi:hypothetical protein
LEWRRVVLADINGIICGSKRKKKWMKAEGCRRKDEGGIFGR